MISVENDPNRIGISVTTLQLFPLQIRHGKTIRTSNYPFLASFDRIGNVGPPHTYKGHPEITSLALAIF